MDSLLFKYMDELQRISQIDQYDAFLKTMRQTLLEEGYNQEILQAIGLKGRYTVNKFSDESTLESMMRAKENLCCYLESIMDAGCGKAKDSLQECLQHLLYAVLKPLCPDARTEVPEDTGYGLVKSDIKIPSLNTVVEAKCTRSSMGIKKLTEEIEADIVHYQADFIYFYIYDKVKIIKDRHSFMAAFNRMFDGKRVEVIILQPVQM